LTSFQISAPKATRLFLENQTNWVSFFVILITLGLLGVCVGFGMGAPLMEQIYTI